MHAASCSPQLPLDPQSRSQQNPAISRASSARDSGLDRSLVGALNNSSHMIHSHSREVKINDIVGIGISGVLYKWVNYGKGWRPRWFVLQNDVLSYYKIHGSDKIVVNQDTEKGSRVIGEESMKRVSRQHQNHPHHHHHHHHRNGNSGSPSKSWKSVGEVHLKTEKVDLENTVVDESQRQLKEVGPSSRSRQDKYSESAIESEDENERVDAAEEDTDEEDNTSFDTKDFLYSSSFKSCGSDFRTSSFSSDDNKLYAF